MLVIFGGLPGTGKSTLALRLAGLVGAVYLRIDTIERAMTGAKEVFSVGEKGYLLLMPSPRIIFGLAASSLRTRSIRRKSRAALGGTLRSAFV